MNFLNFLSSSLNFLNFNISNQDRSGTSLFRSSLPPPTLLNLSELHCQSQPQSTPSKPMAQEPLPSPTPAPSPLSKEAIMPESTPSKPGATQELDQSNIAQLLTQHNQLLLSQYLQLNMHLMNQQIEQKNVEVPQVKTEEGSEEPNRVHRKKIRKVSACEHREREHYAKGFCKNCYLKFGRTKKPWLCAHEKLYAGGLCQNCYINKYNKEKRNREHEAQRMMSSEPNDNTKQ